MPRKNNLLSILFASQCLLCGFASLSQVGNGGSNFMDENIPARHMLVPNTNGDRKFQFYVVTLSGTLEKKWLTLQQVQDMLLSKSISTNVTNHWDSINTKNFSGALPTPEFLTQYNFDGVRERPGGNLEDIVANIQKVVSEELTTTTTPDVQTSPIEEEISNNNAIEAESISLDISKMNASIFSNEKFENSSSPNTIENMIQTTTNVPVQEKDQNTHSQSEFKNDTAVEIEFPVTESEMFTTHNVNMKLKEGYSGVSLMHGYYTGTVGQTQTDSLGPKNAGISFQDQRDQSSKLESNDHQQTNTQKQQLQNTHNSNVLQPTEISSLSRNDINSLGNLGSKGVDPHEEFYDAPVYLEDLPEVDYDYNIQNMPNLKKNNTPLIDLQFPGPDVAISYFKPDHIAETEDKPVPSDSISIKPVTDRYGPVDPSIFLPASNPEIAKGANPLRPTPQGNLGLEVTTANLEKKMKNFVETMNELSFKVYKMTAKIHRRQNMVMSPLNLVSALSMMALGARNTSADKLASLLKLDEFRSFNIHQMLQNITNSAHSWNSYKHEIAFANNIFVAQDNKPYNIGLFSRTLNYFYNSIVSETSESMIGGRARDLTNEAIRKKTFGRVENFLKPSANLVVKGPVGIVSGSYYQGKWKEDLHEANLFDMNFIRFPSAERRLIKTVGVRKQMLVKAGYSQKNDATIAEIPLDSKTDEFSLVFVMPGRQKNFIANGLSQLEQKLDSRIWGELLRTVIPHQLIFEVPVFSHRNYLNLSSTLSEIGLENLFKNTADFSGINGAKNLYIGDIVQLNEFHSVKLSLLRKKRDVEEPPITHVRQPYWRYFQRKNRMKAPVLAYDRAFFYTLRHNPTGLLLFMGRYLDPETF